MSMVEVNMSDDGQVHNKGKSLWIWLAIPPLAAVVGAIITIYLALAYPDPVIKAPINKLGKVMVQDQASIEMARNLGLSARFQRSAGGQIHLYLSGQSQAESLELLWLHATREEWDRGAILLPISGAAGEYRGVLPAPPSENGQWVLRDPKADWRLESAASHESATGEFELSAVLR